MLRFYGPQAVHEATAIVKDPPQGIGALMAKPPRSGRDTVRLIARTLNGAKPAPFPGFVPFCNPSLKAKMPTGAGWLYEFKLDGCRCQLQINTGTVKAFSRTGLDFTREFAPIIDAAAEIPASSIIPNGEVVVLAANARPDSGALRAAIKREPHQLLFYAFDLPYLDGFDIRGATMFDRRKVLTHVIAAQPSGRILLSETIDEPGNILLQHACEMGLEGLVAKRVDAPYRAGRSDTSQKIKCVKSMCFPITGYVPAKGTGSRSRNRFRDIISGGMLRHASFKGMK